MYSSGACTESHVAGICSVTRKEEDGVDFNHLDSNVSKHCPDES